MSIEHKYLKEQKAVLSNDVLSFFAEKCVAKRNSNFYAHNNSSSSMILMLSTLFPLRMYMIILGLSIILGL